MNRIQSFILRIGPTRFIAALVVTALVAAGLFALLFRVGGEEKSLLFSGVSLREAGEITQRLDQSNIEYDLSGDGSTIFVPRSQVLQARMMLSADGLPSRGSVGYEIFDQSESFGQTAFQQNINRLRALEGELARTIGSLDGVAGARVHLVLPERQLFERDKQTPSASIVLELRRDDLTPGQVRAIRNLVASAVPGLQANRVTILDERGDLLAAAANGDGSADVADGVDARQAAAENRIRATVLDIVEGVVGPGKARVQVSAEMDFSRVTETAERFDPEGRVVRSTSSSENANSNQQGGGGAGATASANVPDGSTGGAGASGDSSSGESSQETINYEISRTTRTSVSEGGKITKLSVAVAVDGARAPGENGEPGAYTPRSEEELQRITALVQSAVGYNEQRGDKVEVVNLEFAQRGAGEAKAEDGGLFDFSTLNPMRLAEIGAMLLAALALIFFVLRPLIGGLLGSRKGADADGAAALIVEGGPPALPGPDGAAAIPGVDSHADAAVRVSATRRVADVVQSNPDDTVQIIRGWMNNAS